MAEKNIFKNPEALAKNIAQRVCEISQKERREQICVALTGGKTIRPVYQAMASLPFRKETRWPRFEFFFGDERPVAPDHKDSNFGQARALLPRDIPDSKFHPMQAKERQAQAYEDLIRRHVLRTNDGIPSFGLILLGLGEDGHTASLFPQTEVLSERKQLISIQDVLNRKTYRMSFTYPLINAAERVWIVVTGKRKRNILEKVFSHKDYPVTSDDIQKYPILGVCPTRGELAWFLDSAAAP